MMPQEDVPNPYRPPEPDELPAPPCYASRLRAARAGMRQGAILGAKWMACIMLGLYALMAAVWGVAAAYRCLRTGAALWQEMGSLADVLVLLGAMAVGFVYIVLISAVAGAVAGAMGGALVYYRGGRISEK